jgi:hypothetical protein
MRQEDKANPIDLAKDILHDLGIQLNSNNYMYVFDMAVLIRAVYDVLFFDEISKHERVWGDVFPSKEGAEFYIQTAAPLLFYSLDLDINVDKFMEMIEHAS